VLGRPAPTCSTLACSTLTCHSLQDPGFPVFLDINLSEQEAQNWATYLREGLYIDDLTREITAEIMTYNAPLRILGYLLISFSFASGGSITVGVAWGGVAWLRGRRAQRAALHGRSNPFCVRGAHESRPCTSGPGP